MKKYRVRHYNEQLCIDLVDSAYEKGMLDSDVIEAVSVEDAATKYLEKCEEKQD